MIAVHSTQSWGHFNLLSEYDFSNEKLQDNTVILPQISPRDRPRELGAASQMKRKAHQRDTEKAMLLYVLLLGLGQPNGIGHVPAILQS